MLKKVLLFTLMIMNSWSQEAYELLPQTEAFILSYDEAKESMLIYVLNGAHKGKKALARYEADNSPFKIYAKDKIDHLLRPTFNPKEAYYLHVAYSVMIKPISSALSEEEELRLEENLFTSLENHIPISNRNVVEYADDLTLSCPEVPQKKNGESCPIGLSYKLPSFLKDAILAASIKIDEDPALITSIIHQESQFNLFVENIHEKKICESDKKNCSAYKWGYGLAQLGRSDAHYYGLNWDEKLKRPRKCKGDHNLLEEKCFKAMVKKCDSYKRKNPEAQLMPINCPQAAIEAVAKKLKAMIPKNTPVWLKDSGRLIPFNLSEHLTSDANEVIRNKVGLYNRAVKVVNSMVEYYDLNGEFPKFYGQAWSMPRRSESPSLSIGYQMLTKEYINRCYVWKVAGLCGKLPTNSLYFKYNQQFR